LNKPDSPPNPNREATLMRGFFVSSTKNIQNIAISTMMMGFG